ncbi:hypothetical protein CLV72_10739 [Allonocardiopsis opalescens]|uniref:Uncharacterized protein n=2 Tax=Allonocardiopsis opalescens TaxID=1144618 RepID=A0A2T0PYA0_9ACTN|nr:hypothetical protein CLV72_10739 [Allonocardiopsis opalescens]
MNVWRNSLPAEEFPSGELVIEGVPFHPPRPRRGADDHVTCDGQLLAVAEGGYDWLYLLACSERRVEEEIALHFTGGQVDFEPLRVSDFWAAVPFFGESAAFTSAVMHYPHHVQPRVPGTIWCQRVPVVRRAPLAAVRLPRNAAVHVFAATLVRCG